MGLNQNQIKQLQQCCQSLDLPEGASVRQMSDGLLMFLDMESEKADQAAKAMAAGMELARDFFEGKLPEDVTGVLKKATAGMRPLEAKGFCLMVYSAFRAGDGIPTAAPDTELVLKYTDAQIRELTARDLELHSRAILAGAQAWEGFECSVETLCAAMYICSARGVLPETLAEAPELLGLCCAAGQQAAAQAPDADNGKMLVVLVAAVLALVMIAAAGPAFASGSEALISIVTGAGYSASVEAALLPVIDSLKTLGPALMGTLAYRTGFDSANEFREFYNGVAADAHGEAVARAKAIMEASVEAEI